MISGDGRGSRRRVTSSLRVFSTTTRIISVVARVLVTSGFRMMYGCHRISVRLSASTKIPLLSEDRQVVLILVPLAQRTSLARLRRFLPVFDPFGISRRRRYVGRLPACSLGKM